MSFRNLSLIFITSLLSTILLLQWWSITQFSENVSKQVGESAFEVSRSTAETLIFKQPKIEFRTVTSIGNSQHVSNEIIRQAITQVRQNISIELKNEKIDDFIMLNADGTEYEIIIPRTGIHLALEDFSNNVLYATLLLLVLGIILATYFTHKIAVPLKKLQTASVNIGSGELGTQIVKGKQWHSTEIRTTIDSFNKMSSKIKRLQNQNEALQNRAHLAELAEISRGLAHTIRNPLNTLNLALDQMETETNPEQQSKLTKLAKHQITRIDKWVHSLMDVMADDDKLMKVVNMNEIINQLIDDLKLSNEKSVKFVFIQNPTISDLLVIEPELKSIIQSILVNAVEASPKNSSIYINLEQLQKGCKLTIKDVGQGFSSNVLQKLFTPHNTNKTYGAGMGLYLAERVIKLKYNGEINISNNPDKGSSVDIIINDRGENN